ncbi:MAG: Gfo/Idh/MocA family oxidoreductase [Candidatus Poribacteria bacterium]|nr:Gfo/Idh/MocA family oxidoreductase [Candidatus Poribacteria bacterium]
MKDQLEVGIVGARRGSSFIQPFTTITETKVAAVCDLNENTLNEIAGKFGIEKRFTDYEQMLADEDIDIVVLATPENLHVPQSISALNAQKHVVSEVTAAVSLEQCYELVRAVRGSQTKYMMAENYCYSQSNVLIKNMARQGLFGDIYFGEGEYLHDIKSLHHDSGGNPTWRYYWQVGINRCNYATHNLGPLLQWFDERVVSVSCLGTGVHTDPEHAMEDTVMMLCKTESGALIKIRIDMLSNRPANLYFSLQGTTGCYESARGLGDEDKIWLADYCKPGDWLPLADFYDEFLPEAWKNPPEEAVTAGDVSGEYFELRDFVDSILNDTEPPMDVYDALDFTVPGLVSEQSIANGGMPVEVPNFREID